MPGNVDYVLYWWHRAAELTRSGQIKRFGFITTNSVKQKQGRQVIDGHMKADPPLTLVFAIPDHPWAVATSEAIDKASVRIAMTVGTIESVTGTLSGVLLEKANPEGDGFKQVTYGCQKGKINSDLTIAPWTALYTGDLFFNIAFLPKQRQSFQLFRAQDNSFIFYLGQQCEEIYKSASISMYVGSSVLKAEIQMITTTWRERHEKFIFAYVAGVLYCFI